LITTYKHCLYSYTADLNHDTGQIIFYKTNPSGRRLFSLAARSKSDLYRQTATKAHDWAISEPRKGIPPRLAPYIPTGDTKFIKPKTKE